MHNDQDMRELFQLDALDGFNDCAHQDYLKCENNFGRLALLAGAVLRTKAHVRKMAPANMPPALLPDLPWPRWVQDEIFKWLEAVSDLEALCHPRDKNKPSRDDEEAHRRWRENPTVKPDEIRSIMLEVIGLDGQQGVNSYKEYCKAQNQEEKTSVLRMLVNSGVPPETATELLKHYPIGDPRLFAEARLVAIGLPLTEARALVRRYGTKNPDLHKAAQRKAAAIKRKKASLHLS